MRLKLTSIAIAFCLYYSLNAQTEKAITQDNNSPVITHRTCGTQLPGAEWDAWFNKKVEEFKAARANAKTESQTINYTIPVVVHVIHGGQAEGTFPNISQGQINSQIAVLNKDYAGTGYNITNLPAAFAGTKANTGLSFCLAQLDPNGVTLPEPGIDRVNYVTKGWNNPAGSAYSSTNSFMNYIDGTIKPGTIWDPTRYLNIWITDDNSNLGLLGYATFPAGTGLTGLSSYGTTTTDGVWIWSKSFGSNSIYPSGTYDATYNKGRTASHEIGHWVGLRHTWGDGTCATDYCNDVPPSQTANYGCPSFPHNSGVCSGNTTGEMTMNFMDYSDDACIYMFTNDQTTRMQTAMANGTFRTLLSASSASMCSPTTAAPTASFSMPATGCTNSVITINNLTNGNPVPSYSWTASSSTGVSFTANSTVYTPTLTFTTPGTYTIMVVATNSLGVDSNKRLITISACGVTGINKNSILAANVNIYPNPSNGILNIVTSLPNSQTLEIMIHNSLGQLISTTKYTNVANNAFTVDLTDYSNGVYFVTLNNGEEKIVKRLILNK